MSSYKSFVNSDIDFYPEYFEYYIIQFIQGYNFEYIDFCMIEIINYIFCG